MRKYKRENNGLLMISSWIHLWDYKMQTHVKLFFCGSAQMIMKKDLRRIIIF